MLESIAWDKFKNEVCDAVIAGADVVELNDGGVRELSDDLGFVKELLLATLVKALNESFESDGPADDGVVGAIDPAAGASANSLQHLVAAVL
jgi:hypothetical protein